MRELPLLETPRLILRAFAPGDARRTSFLMDDEEVALNSFGVAGPLDEELTAQWIEEHQAQFNEEMLMNLAIVLREDDEVIGAIHLEIDPHNDSGEIGYWLGRPYRGRGYATEAARRVVQYGFQDMALQRIYAMHLQRNVAAGRVLQKLCMTHEGCLRRHVKVQGQYENLICYGVLRGES
ncbi:hypothetical protein BE17_36195 [Sorangium cellulosum]|uniref:N-acetyltransferase domain-containing protein n=1 Tax=Sorangium cellulosum TaxID=56 RepID=A0A150SIP2_SORCE|nr:hypothetical protein BE17_36195 [Sorangium cellulosum]